MQRMQHTIKNIAFFATKTEHHGYDKRNIGCYAPMPATCTTYAAIMYIVNLLVLAVGISSSVSPFRGIYLVAACRACMRQRFVTSLQFKLYQCRTALSHNRVPKLT